MADITGKDTAVKGVNSVNYTRYFAYHIDGKENSEILAVGTHNIIMIPAGHMLASFKIAVLSNTLGGSGATVQIKVPTGAVSSPRTCVQLQKGFLYRAEANASMTLSLSDEGIPLQLVVTNAALTALDWLVVIETIPVKEFITAG